MYRRRFLQASTALAIVASVGVGTVTAEEVTEVEDWHDLTEIRDDLGGDYELVNDLDENTEGYEEHVADPEGGWEPIGDWDRDEDVEFTGTFDGGGHEIAGLKIDREEQDYVGLFGGIEGLDTKITDLKLTGVEVTGQDAVGGLIGRNAGEVVRTSVSGEVTGNMDVGGLAGFSNGIIVEESSADVDVTGDAGVGGLLGFSSGQDVENTYVNGIITGNERVGGLIGRHEAGAVSHSFATGDIDADTESVGGLVGEFGREFDLDPPAPQSAVLIDSYWDTTKTGMDESVGEIQDEGIDVEIDDVSGLPTEEMQGKDATEHMAALDFDDTWGIVVDPADYPHLRWEDVPTDDEPAPPDDVDQVVDITVAHDDGPEPDDLPDYDVREDEMFINVFLEDSEADQWPQELAGLGVEDDTVFEVTVEVENFTPHMLVGTGSDAGWQIEERDDGITEVTITASPSNTQFITEPEMPTLDDWPEGDDDQADFAFNHVFTVSMFDLEGANVPADERDVANGTVVMTDAQAFDFSNFSAPGEPGQGELALEVAGPGLDVDGNDNEGFFDVFLPETVLTEWGVEDPDAHLSAAFADEDVDFTATETDDGLQVELDISYSVGEASVEAQAAALDPAFTLDPADPNVGEDVDFDASDSTADGEIDEYAWDFDDGETAVGEEVTHAFDESGTYDVILTLTDEFGGTNTTSKLIEVSDPDDPLEDYTTDDGVIDTDGLRDGVADWRGGDIDTETLREIVNYWRSGETVSG